MYLNNNTIDTSLDKKKYNNKYIIIGILSLIILFIVCLLIFNKKTEYFLVLNGDTDVIIYEGSEYIENGFKAYDSKGKTYDEKNVTIEGNVNTNTAGEYKLTYTFKNIKQERNITVISNNSRTTILGLYGDPVIFIPLGEEYKEPDYYVIDSNYSSEEMHDKVQVTGKVDTNTAGTYRIKYSLVSNQNIIISKERIVIVTSADFSLNYEPKEYTNKSVKIYGYISNNYFDKIVLPNSKEEEKRNFSYEVTENGIYKFILKLKDGTTKEESIEIKNIDKNKPTGSCIATISNNTIIKVNAKDENGISGYNYIIDDYKSGYFATETYTYEKVSSIVSVEVQDKAGNTALIKCTIKKQQSTSSKSSSSSSKPPQKDKMEIHFIDSSQPDDAILIRTSNKTIMIDGGSKYTKKNVLNYLNALGIKKIDAMIGSHMHSDHIQTQGYILDTYTVDKIYYPDDIFTCHSYGSCTTHDQEVVLDAIKRHNMTPSILKAGDKLTIGNINIYILAPWELKKEQNINSFVFILTFGNNSFMFTGDTGDTILSSNTLKTYANKLNVPLKVDLFKWPHHGTRDISDSFVKTISPRYVIIPNVDSYNPNSDTVNRFNKVGATIYQQKKYGNVLFISDGNNISVVTKTNPSDYKR